jgi:hypothetical protein
MRCIAYTTYVEINVLVGWSFFKIIILSYYSLRYVCWRIRKSRKKQDNHATILMFTDNVNVHYFPVILDGQFSGIKQF